MIFPRSIFSRALPESIKNQNLHDYSIFTVSARIRAPFSKFTKSARVQIRSRTDHGVPVGYSRHFTRNTSVLSESSAFDVALTGVGQNLGVENHETRTSSLSTIGVARPRISNRRICKDYSLTASFQCYFLPSCLIDAGAADLSQLVRPCEVFPRALRCPV